MDYDRLTFSHLLHLTAHHWRLAVDRRLKALGMSQASWMAVSAIARHAAPLSQRELADELGVETATLVPLLNRLAEQGLIERAMTDNDKRKRLLVATPKGEALYHEVRQVADRFREDVLTTITPEEQQQVRAVLTRLLQEVQKA